MLPSEILPAITRQKVKNTNDERYTSIIGEVIKLVDSELLVDTPLGLRWWNIEDCEPVPEEPRWFRVNDKVAIAINANSYSYCLVETVAVRNGKTIAIFTYGDDKPCDLSRIRLATPEEVAQFFN